MAVCLVAVTGLGGCSGPRPPTKEEIAACQEAQKTLDAAEDTFVDRVKELRKQHILMVEYDRQMIAALTAYRDRMWAVLYAEEAVSGERWRCAGKPLADLKLDAAPKLERVEHFVGSFQEALRNDPKDAYVE